MSTKEKIQEDLLVDTLEKEQNEIVLYNDDVNTFDHVIESLMEICGHDEIQATQCTYLIHFRGKCAVKSGSADKLIPMKVALNDRGISAEVE